MDTRDETTWIAVELSRLGEQKVEEGTITSTLRSDLKVGDAFPVFVPTAIYRKHTRIITIHLMEGYVFVASGLPEGSYFALERLAYVSSVMSTQSGPHRMRTLAVLPEVEIEALRTQLQEMLAAEVEVGSTVTVTEGKFRRMDGRVIGLDGDNAFIRFDLRSWRRIASVPRVFLEQLEPAPA